MYTLAVTHFWNPLIVNQFLPINQPKARAVKKGINQNPQGKKLSVLYKRDYLSGGLLSLVRYVPFLQQLILRISGEIVIILPKKTSKRIGNHTQLLHNIPLQKKTRNPVVTRHLMMVTKVDIHILIATSMIKIEKKDEAHPKLNMTRKMKEVSDQTNIKIEN